jgi:MFS transporter, AAHS family, benzoate transport protein
MKKREMYLKDWGKNMHSVNVGKFIDESKFTGFHAWLVFFCGFILTFDGFDLVIYGTIVPVLMKEWSLTPVETGTLASYALFGMMIGAMIFGPLADKWGRKNVILLCVTIFSIFTVLVGFSHGPTQFGIYRFIAGLGLGGVMPNTIALITEYSPKKLKSTMVSVMFSGYSVGGMLAAGLGILLIPKFGWESVFFVGGLPLLALPIMYLFLPDSPGFLIAKNKHEKVGQILSKIDKGFRPEKGVTYELVTPKQPGSSIVKLFENGRALSTIMFWIAFFMGLLMIYGLNTWLPKLMTQAGYPLGSSLMFLLVLNFGAIVGAIFGGWAADRWSAKVITILYFALAGIVLTLLGFGANMFLLYLMIGIAGGSTIGTQIITNSFASQFYPFNIRSTGVGWALGIGRIGALVGPIMGGYLLSMQLPFYQNFIAFAIPGIIGAVAVMFIQEKHSAAYEAKQKQADKQSITL